jgi:hypothetical protein
MMETMATASFIVNPILLAVLGYMLKRWIERLETTIKDILKTQGECQITLARVYRTKAEAEADSSRQWDKLDDLGNRMTRVETRLESDGK